MKKKRDDEYLTTAADERAYTVQTGGVFPNQKSVPGDSVKEHKRLEAANVILGEEEIRQQNENL